VRRRLRREDVTESDGEFPEQPADDVAHEQQRDEHGDERYGQREDGETDLLGPFERGLQRLLASSI